MTNNISQEGLHRRKPSHPIHPLILGRWSPRAMTGEPIDDQELFSLFEAARWAPSSYNGQPWRFIYAKRETPYFQQFLELLVESNQSWANKAAVLGVIASRKTFERNEKPSITHAFDTGAAWENLCLEGVSRGLVVHGMEGFDYKRAQSSLEIPDEYEVLAMFVLGKKAPKSTLTPELQQREVPSDRKSLKEIVMEGKFQKSWL